jgi:uncharacterized protein YcfJ
MKRIILAAAVSLAAAAPFAQAQPYPDRPYDRPYVAPDRADAPYDRRDERWRGDDRREERARVIDSRPVAGDQEECWNDDTHSYEKHRIGAGTVIGAIAGGVIGHQFGSGRGNTAATAAGAIGGGVLGNRIDRNRADNDSQQRCRTVRDDTTTGYDVRYEYRGRQYETYLDHDPGRWLVVGRDTEPDGSPLADNRDYGERDSHFDRDRR